MAAEYRLDIKTAAGVKFAEINDFLSLGYTSVVNAPGMCRVALPGDHSLVPSLSSLLDAQVEVWWRDIPNAVPWHCDFYGLLRSHQKIGVDPGVVTITIPGQMSLLARRIIAYPADTLGRSAFVNEVAETIAKNLVKYNAVEGFATTANGRDRTPNSLGITVATDNLGGWNLDWNCARRNLLTELQDLAQVAGDFFDLVKTGAATWEFRWYFDYQGTDRRTTLLFSPERGNMADPEYSHNRLDEKTVAIVGGQGERTARQIVVRTGANYAAGNDIEVFIDARNDESIAALEDEGDRGMVDAQAREIFTFKPVQTPATQFGKHYFLGDKVRATAFGVTADFAVHGVSTALAENGERTLDVELRRV